MQEPGWAQRQIEGWILREHMVIAKRLKDDPDKVIRKAKDNIARWGWRDLPVEKRPRFMADWMALLDGPLDDLFAVLTGTDEHSVTLRSSSPFAGVITQEERLQIRESRS